MNNDFNEKSIPKLVLHNAIPAILAMIMVLVYNMADLFFIGQTNDPLQVAAVSLATPVFMVFMALSSIFGVGGTSIISRSFGRKDVEYAKKVSSFCFWGSAVIGAILAITIFIFSTPLATLLGASSDTLDMVSTYLRLVALSGPFTLISSAFSNIIRAEGNPKTAMMGMVIGNLINIVLDPVFILGLDLGITGAALATVAGNVCGALFYMHYLVKDKSKLGICLKDFTVKHKVFTNVMVIGIPASIASLLMSVSNIIVNGLLAGYGDLAVAGIGVAMKVTMVTTFMCIGFGQGIQPILGFAIGAKDFTKFKLIIRFSLLFSLALASILTGLCYLGLDSIVSLFLSNQEAFDYGLSFSKILLSSSFLFGMFFVFVNALQAIGAAKSSLLINISRQGLLFIPMVFVFNNVFGATGIVLAQPVTDILSFIIAAALYIGVSKKFDTLTSQQPGEVQHETI